MIGFAVLFGLLAVFIARAWLNSQEEMRMRNMQAQKKPLTTKTIVVAAKPLRYGMELTADSLREIPWSQDAVPKGAFNSISEILVGGKRSTRVNSSHSQISYAVFCLNDNQLASDRHAV